MPPTTIPRSTLEALNTNELEILRLLASGHTTKSIAASLGRSETAINERLREARRKTGLGSSRELARLLDAQKIWDNNIDLSEHGASSEGLDQPRPTGLSWSKGKTLMLITLPVAALGLAFVSGTATHEPAPTAVARTASVAQSPLLGRWTLDVSRVPVDERPQRVEIEFAAAPDNRIKTRVEIVAPDGTLSQATSLAGLDGEPMPVTGTMAFVDTVSLRQPEANTLVMTLGNKGAPVATRIYTVTADRRTMTETIIWPSDRMPKMETTYFARAD